MRKSKCQSGTADQAYKSDHGTKSSTILSLEEVGQGESDRPCGDPETSGTDGQVLLPISTSRHLGSAVKVSKQSRNAYGFVTYTTQAMGPHARLNAKTGISACRSVEAASTYRIGRSSPRPLYRKPCAPADKPQSLPDRQQHRDTRQQAVLLT
jgi:hypothetical protein